MVLAKDLSMDKLLVSTGYFTYPLRLPLLVDRLKIFVIVTAIP